MPELPEVEIVKRGLEEIFRAAPTIVAARLMRAKIRFVVPPSLPARLVGMRVLRVRRRAKYILIDTSGATLLCHLGMTGSWRVMDADGEDKHDHFCLELNDGTRLAFRDPRRFGLLDLIEPGCEGDHVRLQLLGPEPLDTDNFSGVYLKTLSRGRSIAVKAFLMDQRIVVGIGNIYASETLFQAGVRPQRPAGKVTAAEWRRIAMRAQEVLSRAIDAGGSSIRDYRSAKGEAGGFQEEHRVYDRMGLPCLVCKNLIKAKIIGGRSSFYCPKCQR